MEQWQKVTIGVLGAVVLGLASFSIGYSAARRHETSERTGRTGDQKGLELIREAYGEIRSSAVEPPANHDLARAAVRGMVRTLKRTDDPYALLYSPDGYESFQELTSGHFSGIGVWLAQRQDKVEIVSVLPGTPALRAGLARGDMLSSIDGRPVEHMSVEEAVQHIKGRPGTEVALGVTRDGVSLRFEVTRRSIQLPNLVARVTGGELGYIRLLGFARGAGAQLRAKVSSLTEKGVEGLILDLRDNGGGLFSEGINVASVFIDKGKIATYKARSHPRQTYRAAGDAFGNIPLIVLINEGTASASEIVAGALQDRERAILVGERTYGKGSVQEIFPLSDASALKLTTGAYFTPSGRNISGHGIEPDVRVDSSRTAQKQRAVEILKGIVISTDGAQG